MDTVFAVLFGLFLALYAFGMITDFFVFLEKSSKERKEKNYGQKYG